MSATTQQENILLGYGFFLTQDAAQALRVAAFAGLKAAPARGLEIGGVLTSSDNRPSNAIIDGIELMPCDYGEGYSYRVLPEEKADFQNRIDRLRVSKSQTILGYFRSATDDAICFDDRDLRTIREFLPESRYLLVLKPFHDGHASVRVFKKGEENNWQTFAIFDLIRESKARLPIQPVPGGASIASPKSNVDSMPLISSVLWQDSLSELSPKSSTRRGLLIVVLLSIIPIGSILFWTQNTGRLTRTGIVIPALRVNSDGGIVQVRWELNSGIIASVRDGILLIADGVQQYSIPLSRSQLEAGSLFYKAKSQNATFQLSIHAHDGSTLANTLQVTAHLGSGALDQGIADNLTGKQRTLNSTLRSPNSRDLNAKTTAASSQLSAIDFSAHTGALSASAARENKEIELPATQLALPIALPIYIPILPVNMLHAEYAANKGRAAANISPLTLPVVRGIPSSNLITDDSLRPVLSSELAMPADVRNGLKPKHEAGGQWVYMAPKIREQVPPNLTVDERASVFKHAQVQIGLWINEKGRVTEVHVIQRDKGISLSIIGALLQSARESVFTPARLNGKNVSSTQTIVFALNPPAS